MDRAMINYGVTALHEAVKFEEMGVHIMLSYSVESDVNKKR